MIYLVDTSAWERLRLSDHGRDRLGHLGKVHEIATCPAIAGELLYAARDYADLRDYRQRLETLRWLETTDDAQIRALQVQQDLARRGAHREVGLIGLLVAATAELHWATVLHWHPDFERIAEVTGQPHEWIVPRGQRCN